MRTKIYYFQQDDQKSIEVDVPAGWKVVRNDVSRQGDRFFSFSKHEFIPTYVDGLASTAFTCLIRKIV